MTESFLRECLTPEHEVRRPPSSDTDAVRYVRSYLIMRRFVGVLGVALPPGLMLINSYGFGGELLPSLSAYYYSGARELFVGTLSAIGIFLITYKVAEINLDNTLSTVAGVTVVLVAVLPTKRPDEGIGLTPWQESWSETTLWIGHLVAAATFIASLAAISFFFGEREDKRDKTGMLSPRFWRNYHRTCAGIIGAALLWCAATLLPNWEPSRGLLIGETAAVLAFGASWLAKGLDTPTPRPASKSAKPRTTPVRDVGNGP